jgi:hypothetical protein
VYKIFLQEKAAETKKQKVEKRNKITRKIFYIPVVPVYWRKVTRTSTDSTCSIIKQCTFYGYMYSRHKGSLDVIEAFLVSNTFTVTSCSSGLGFSQYCAEVDFKVFRSAGTEFS